MAIYLTMIEGLHITINFENNQQKGLQTFKMYIDTFIKGNIWNTTRQKRNIYILKCNIIYKDLIQLLNIVL